MSSIFIANNAGNVMVNSQGNSFKQNYLFGNALGSSSALSYYPDIKNLSLTSFTLNLFMNAKSGGNAGYNMMRIYFSSGNYYDIVNNVGTFSYMGKNGTQFGTYAAQVTGSAGVQMRTYYITQTSITHTGVLVNTISESGNTITEIQLFGPGLLGGYGPGWPNSFFTYIALYNRQLSGAELTQLYNNKQGNDLPSILGLQALYNINLAEVLDMTPQGGASAVCGFRDTSGNNHHAYINGLIAGSASAQAAALNASGQIGSFL